MLHTPTTHARRYGHLFSSTTSFLTGSHYEPMKNIARKITTAIVLTVSLGLASCEKDSLLSPDKVTGKADQGVNSIGTPIPTPTGKYTLTKYGMDNLTYYDDGRLMSVLHGAAPASHTDYTYSPGTIKAVTYQNNLVVRDETFLLDASGRCTESVIKGVLSDIHWLFTYNVKGQLSYCTNKASTTGATSYAYNAAGDLILTQKSVNPNYWPGTTFAYGSPLLADKYPLNVVGASDHDPYLRIFGTPSKHLVKQATYEPSGDPNFPAPADRLYTYVLDANGYVTQQKANAVVGGALIDTKPYAYQIGPFQF